MKPRSLIAAGLTSVAIGALAAPANAAWTNYGGLSYQADYPMTDANCVQHNYFDAIGTATVTGTLSARVMYVFGGTWRIFSSRDAQILRGTKVNLTWDLTNGNREGVRFRNQMKFAGGAWNVSIERVGPYC